MDNRAQEAAIEYRIVTETLFAVFVIFKLTGVIDWAWIWVCLPMLLNFVIILVLIILIKILEWYERKKRIKH